jgi:hypothetical protein
VRRVPLDERGIVVLVGVVAVALALAEVAPAVAAAILIACALVFRIAWWMPWALAVGLVALGPLLVWSGRPETASLAATMAVVCMGVAVAMLALERRRAGTG